jgi:DNA-binding transcriptional regulator LsrR (DeoR family)
MKELSRRQLLAEIASLYYIEKKTQAKIGKDLGYSRSAISRLLLEAEKEGIVKIAINYPIQRDSYLEQRLINEFDLEAAYVIKRGNYSYDEVLRMVGRVGAMYLEQHLRGDMVMGIGWGTAVFEVVNSFPYLPLVNVRVVQVMGAIGSKSNPQIDGPEIASFLASKLNASYQVLHSPLFLDSETACSSLKSQKQIYETFNLAYQSDFVLLGVGTIDIDPMFSSIFRSGFMNEKEVMDIKKKGGIGNFCGIIIDEKGQIMNIDINHRTMAVDLNKLKNSKGKIIGVAAGYEKNEAIKAVLNGRWLDVLITDQMAVNSIFN